MEKNKKIGNKTFFSVLSYVILNASFMHFCDAQNKIFGRPWESIRDFGISSYLVAGDVDKDGDMDLLVLHGGCVFNSRSNDSSAWDSLFFNDGNGWFQERAGALPKVGLNRYYNCVAGDLDGDGDLDFLFSTWYNGVGVYLNDSKGNFKFLRGQSIGFGNYTGPVYLADFDQDGDLDAVVGFHFFLNQGRGNFQDFSLKRFPPIHGNYYGASFADFDKDGDLDIIFSGAFPNLLFLENDGKGFFKDRGSARTPFPPYNTKAPLMEGVDVDGDGSKDLVILPYAFLNDGKGNFSSSRKVILAQYGGNKKNEPYQVCFFDADGDGKMDYLGTSWNDFTFHGYSNQWNRGGRIRLFRNLGGGKFQDWTFSHLPQVRVGSSPYYNQFAVGDFDGDGDQDFVLDGGSVYAFYNDGKGHFNLGSKIGVPIDPEEPLFELGQWGVLGDLDGDGDLDWVLGVEYTCEPKRRVLLVFLNDGEGRFKDGTDLCLPSGLKRTGKGQRVRYLDLHDVDGDGDLDLLVGWEHPSGGAMLLNDGKGKFSFGGGGQWLYPGYWMDVDGDGLEDSCQGLYWSKNLGKGFFQYKGRFVSKSLIGQTYGCTPSDLDGDGDLDLVITLLDTTKNYNLYDLVILENQGKRKWGIKFKAEGLGSGYFYVCELDGDGDPDLLSWNGIWANEGDGRFIYTTLHSRDIVKMVGRFLMRSVGYHVHTLKDLDGDGLPEIVYNAKSDYDRWFPRYQPDPWWGSYVGVAQNLGDFRFRDATRDYIGNFGIVGGTNGRIFLEDVDGDGDLDLLAQGEYQGLPQVWFNLHQQTAVSGTWGLGKKGHVEVYGHPGDQVLLMAGKPGKPVKIPGFGTWRLGGAVIPLLTTTLRKDPNRVNAVHDLALPVPKVPALIGAKVRFQSLLFRPGYGFKLTNSDTATVTGL